MTIHVGVEAQILNNLHLTLTVRQNFASTITIPSPLPLNRWFFLCISYIKGSWDRSRVYVFVNDLVSSQ
jgi:hypothetical protein